MKPSDTPLKLLERKARELQELHYVTLQERNKWIRKYEELASKQDSMQQASAGIESQASKKQIEVDEYPLEVLEAEEYQDVNSLLKETLDGSQSPEKIQEISKILKNFENELKNSQELRNSLQDQTLEKDKKNDELLKVLKNLQDKYSKENESIQDSLLQQIEELKNLNQELSRELEEHKGEAKGDDNNGNEGSESAQNKIRDLLKQIDDLGEENEKLLDENKSISLLRSEIKSLEDTNQQLTSENTKLQEDLENQSKSQEVEVENDSNNLEDGKESNLQQEEVEGDNEGKDMTRSQEMKQLKEDNQKYIDRLEVFMALSDIKSRDIDPSTQNNDKSQSQTDEFKAPATDTQSQANIEAINAEIQQLKVENSDLKNKVRSFSNLEAEENTNNPPTDTEPPKNPEIEAQLDQDEGSKQDQEKLKELEQFNQLFQKQIDDLRDQKGEDDDIIEDLSQKLKKANDHIRELEYKDAQDQISEKGNEVEDFDHKRCQTKLADASTQNLQNSQNAQPNKIEEFDLDIKQYETSDSQFIKNSEMKLNNRNILEKIQFLEKEIDFRKNQVDTSNQKTAILKERENQLTSEINELSQREEKLNASINHNRRQLRKLERGVEEMPQIGQKSQSRLLDLMDRYLNNSRNHQDAPFLENVDLELRSIQDISTPQNTDLVDNVAHCLKKIVRNSDKCQNQLRKLDSYASNLNGDVDELEAKLLKEKSSGRQIADEIEELEKLKQDLERIDVTVDSDTSRVKRLLDKAQQKLDEMDNMEASPSKNRASPKPKDSESKIDIYLSFSNKKGHRNMMQEGGYDEIETPDVSDIRVDSPNPVVVRSFKTPVKRDDSEEEEQTLQGENFEEGVRGYFSRSIKPPLPLQDREQQKAVQEEISKENQLLKEDNDSLRFSVNSLRGALVQLQQENSELKALTDNNDQSNYTIQEVEELESQNDQSQKLIGELQAKLGEQEKLVENNRDLGSQVSYLNRCIADLQKQIVSLSNLQPRSDMRGNSPQFTNSGIKNLEETTQNSTIPHQNFQRVQENGYNVLSKVDAARKIIKQLLDRMDDQNNRRRGGDSEVRGDLIQTEKLLNIACSRMKGLNEDISNIKKESHQIQRGNQSSRYDRDLSPQGLSNQRQGLSPNSNSPFRRSRLMSPNPSNMFVKNLETGELISTQRSSNGYPQGSNISPLNTRYLERTPIKHRRQNDRRSNSPFNQNQNNNDNSSPFLKSLKVVITNIDLLKQRYQDLRHGYQLIDERVAKMVNFLRKKNMRNPAIQNLEKFMETSVLLSIVDNINILEEMDASSQSKIMKDLRKLFMKVKGEVNDLKKVIEIRKHNLSKMLDKGQFFLQDY